MAGPLEHIVVMEAAPVIPGSIAGMLLADHGAQVIKVEPRGGAFFAHELSRKGWDRGKKSVELDLFDAADRMRLRALLKGADVFFHALTDGEVAEIGLDAASLERDFPALIVCKLSASHDRT
ncbi:CoA transferase [Sphingobium chlorophenolicum]|uniref:CoA transferase n=1 Tax=Sphingobium chlorophenolicum TaxID=46429 RepID=UPI0001E52B5C|nr:CoA transferase [Sphingobium chlorophenolicum]